MGDVATMQMAGAGALTAGALAAEISAAISSAGTAIMSFLAAIGPVGWVIIAVIAIVALVYIYWNEICDFFSWLWDKAKIVYEWTATVAIPAVVDTATDVWDSVSELSRKIHDRYVNGIRKWQLALAAAAAATLIPDEEVYLLTMEIPKNYYDERIFRRGVLSNFFYFDPVDGTGRSADCRYKYGTTKIAIGARRYYGDDIWNEFVRGRLMYHSFLKPLNMYQSRIAEKECIYAYFLEYLMFPPGNSKLG